MSEFHFLRPEWFWLLLPAALLLFRLWRQQLHNRNWQAVCDSQLLPYLLLGRSQRRRNWPLHLILLAMLLAVVALAGPTWERLPQPLFRQNSALVILLDLSASMNSADLKPSRLRRAQLKLNDILQLRREGQTALVVFAGDAFTVTPLTNDFKTIAALLDSLEPGLMPTLGSRPELALKQGRLLLQQAGLAQGNLLLVTDDDEPQAAMAEAAQLYQDGYQLSVLGIGTTAGAPVPIAGGGFLKDADGQVVIPQLNIEALQQLATTGGGSYQTMTVDDRDLQALMAQTQQPRLDPERQESGHLGDQWREAGVWLLWPLLCLFACAFRRGWLTLIILCWFMTPPAQAFEWQQLWKTSDQQGAQAFADEDYATAASRFEDPRWQASALYRAGQYAAAAELLEDAESVDDWYNLGNALAKQGDLQKALSAYEEALKQNPQNEDALHNKHLVEEALQQQQPPQPTQNDKAQPEGEESGQQKQDPSSPDTPPQPGEEGAPQQPSESDSAKEQSQSANPAQQQPETDPEAETAESKNAETNAAQQQEAPTQSAEDSKKPKEEDGEISTGATESQDQPDNEEERASQQWLQRIPDDPGGLLRRKFLYQYRQRKVQEKSDKSW